MVRLRSHSLAVTILICLAAVTSLAQTLEAPFVSRLRTEVEEGNVRLYWKDAPGERIRRYNVYRSLLPFSDESFDRAQLVGTVDAGVEGYTDKPDQAGEYHYAVLGVTEEGQVIRMFVTFRNVTSNPVVFIPPTPTGQVINVSARVSGDRVIIDFQATDATENVLIVRTSEYPETRDDLVKGVLVATLPGTSTTYQDIPPPGLGFYYTVVNAKAYAQSSPGLFSRSNRTPEPVGVQLTQVQTRPQVIGPQPFSSLAAPEVEIILPSVSQLLAQRQRPTPAAAEPATPTPGESAPTPTISLLDLGYRERVLRVLPLPRLALNEDIVSGRPGVRYSDPLPQPRSLTPAARQILDNLSKSIVEPEIPSPTILPEERTATGGLAERLSAIVNGAWAEKNWNSAIQELTRFLSLDMEAKIRARAYFYRAQAYLFSNQPERAGLDLTAALDSYRPQVTPYLDYLLLGRRR